MGRCFSSSPSAWHNICACVFPAELAIRSNPSAMESTGKIGSARQRVFTTPSRSPTRVRVPRGTRTVWNAQNSAGFHVLLEDAGLLDLSM
jgi:hypothetical protein